MKSVVEYKQFIKIMYNNKEQEKQYLDGVLKN